jgi:hypothetical protein
MRKEPGLLNSPGANISRFVLLLLITLFLASSCSTGRFIAKTVEHKAPVNTGSREIVYQDKKVYSFNEGEITFDNKFDGARLNECTQINDSTFTVLITPENIPINSSPWYSFRVVSKDVRAVYINIKYKGVRHRYQPKLSYDCINWDLISDENVVYDSDTMGVQIKHLIKADTTWFSAQELENSDMNIKYWSDRLADSDFNLVNIGETPLGKRMIMLDIYKGEKKNMPVIAVLGRQHPPEISGFYAMKAFVDRIMEDDELAKEFRSKYRTIVFPMINPDGVDLGHWRHNTGGIDLNRDWGIYNQPEVRMVADRIVYESKRNKADVVLGIDFHSTHRDIYYTQNVDPSTMILEDFKDKWLAGINDIIPGEDLNESPSGVYPGLTTKNWMYTQFNAVGIIYEVGDRTPREFIKRKAVVAAEVMMKILISE